MKQEVLINPRVMWACVPAEQTWLHFVEGPKNPTLPREGEVLMYPFIQDPHSRQPVPVRILEIQRRQDATGDLLVVVVGRTDQAH